MNHTFASTALQHPTTQKTSGADTAPTASSGIPQTIESFIKQKLGEAGSAVGSGISDSAARAARLGFENSANLRYSQFLEAFRSSPRLTETYQERYPNSLFLPWPALHAVRKALNLWIDLPKFYRGAVPEAQLPWMEIFELDPFDRPTPWDARSMLPDLSETGSLRVRLAVSMMQNREWRETGDLHYVSVMDIQAATILRNRGVEQFWREANESFFVVAPPESFSSTEDWLSRFHKLAVTADEQPTNPPPDPLVIRFCAGGCLVVAAWGDEAEFINEATKTLGI